MPEDPQSSEVFRERFILSGVDDAQRTHQTLQHAIAQCSYDAGSQFAVRLALEEALSNAFKHGNKNDPDKVVTVDCQIDRDSIVIDIADEGEGFDPEVVPDPTEEENLEIPSGRGLVLMRSFMTEVTFCPPGNRVRMRFERPNSK